MAGESLLGMAGEFADPETLTRAARLARREGYNRLDAFTPFPLPELASLLEFDDRAIGWGTFIGAALGIAFGLWLGYYINLSIYVLNVGGRPPGSWPAFVLPAFETAILFGAIGAVGTMLVENGLPRLHHPVFEIPGFERASDNRFFLMLEAGRPDFEPERARRLLGRAGALRITEVRRRWSE